MNAFNSVFAASFADFIIDMDGEVNVKDGIATFSLRQKFDRDVYFVATIPVQSKNAYYYSMPKGSIDPQDEQEYIYEGMKVDTNTIATVTDSRGVTICANMPFVLNSEQVRQLNIHLDDICEREFEKTIDSFEPDYEECF